jgi:hydroxymethylpyrimidine/phosphomethylpyrimidine kinase
MRTALTIAGSDSGGGAGIQADLKTFAAFRVYGTTAITAITAQNTERVHDVLTLPPELVTAQVDAVAADIRIDAVKTGMLATAAIVEVTAHAVRRWQLPHLVIDPVMVAKSGDPLLKDDAVEMLKRELLPLAQVVTPNRPEAEALARMPIANWEDARTAARKIHALGPKAVIVKGGHFEGPMLTNLLFDGNAFREYMSRRHQTRHTHGTGCTFASAIAALLALGTQLPDAVRLATEYVAGAVAHGVPVGHGHGPLDHFWRGVPRTESAG